MGATFSFDVFVSYNTRDKQQVRRIAESLRSEGLKVWFDEWVIQPGDDIYLAIEYGLEASKVLVLCLSSHALSSDWVRLERSTVLFRDPTNVGRRFVPLLLSDCELPDSLRRYAYVDFRQESEAGLEKLVQACRASKFNDKNAANAEPCFAETINTVVQNHPLKDNLGQGSKRYVIGDKGPHDGRVFFVDESGLHGLEAHPYDLYEHYVDYRRGEAIFQRLFGDKRLGITWGDAVKVINKNYPGWRLPTKEELNLLYMQKDVIRGFTDRTYWSSTKNNTTIGNVTYGGVWAQDFDNGDQRSWGEESIYDVRLVREF